MNQDTSLSQIAALLRGGRRMLVLTHIAPDGDAIGSLLGLDWLLRALRQAQGNGSGGELCLVCGDEVPEELTFLPGAENLQRAAPAGPWDVVVGLDASDPQRLGEPFKPDTYAGAPVIVIDHHVTNLHFGSHNYVDVKAAATAQIVADLAGPLGVEISQQAATCLLTGMVTDTRGFRTSNVTLALMHAATRMMERGANLAAISEQALNYRPFSTIRLWGAALSNVQLEQNVAWTSVTQAMRSSVGAPLDDGGLVSFLLNAPEAHVSAVFTEKSDTQVEISLRSKPGYNVAQVALSLGGGGHAQASGCTVDGSLESVQARVLPLLRATASAPALR